MPAPLKIKLSEDEDLTLRELSVAQSLPKRTRIRAMVLRLSNQGWSVAKISNYFHYLSSRQGNDFKLLMCISSAFIYNSPLYNW